MANNFYNVYIGTIWLVRDVWPGTARESQNKHAFKKTIYCLLILKVIFKIPKCKNWSHQFLLIKTLVSLMSKAFAFLITKKTSFFFIYS